MRRFSKLFWFTLSAGTPASALYSAGLLSFLSMRLNAAVALCGLEKGEGCPSYETLDHWLNGFITAEFLGTPLIFWLAFKFGRICLTHAPQIPASTVQ